MGTGAVAVDAAHPDTIGHVGISLSFGLVVMIVIHAIGDISGAHINPAVSLAFAVAGRFPARDVPAYWISQCAGAIAGSFLVYLLFGSSGNFGATTYSGPTGVAFAVEFLFTAILMFVIMGVSSGDKEKAITAGIAIGGTIALEAMVGGPITGASMNPARSLGPAVLAQSFGQIWLYIAAPILGAISGVFIYWVVGKDDR